MKYLILFLIVLSLSRAEAQTTISLSKSHNPAGGTMYEVDFLKLDSLRFFALSLRDKEVKNILAKDTTIVVTTRLTWIYNDKVLVNKKTKKTELGDIKTDDILLLEKISASDALLKYGLKTKYGLILLKTRLLKNGSLTPGAISSN